MSADSQNAMKKMKNVLDQMEAINPINHYYNIYCLGRLSENINKVRIAVLLFLKYKLYNEHCAVIQNHKPQWQFA